MKPTEVELAQFAAAVAARLGLRVDLERASEVIDRRSAVHREPVAAYLARLDPLHPLHPDELDALANELTVGESYFFRHIEQFRAFSDLAAPDRFAQGRLRVLSAACSTGEEPYTIAMLLRDAYPGAGFTTHAIDVNPRAIARARAGRYSRWSLRATSPAFEGRWFQIEDRDVVVVPEIRAAVTFENANVLDDGVLGTAGQWDVVFCRNMMMYFAEDRADALIARLAHCLAPGGYLFLGHAESLRDRSEHFTLCHTQGAFYYQRKATTTTFAAARAPALAVQAPAGQALDQGWHDDIHAAAERVHAMVDGALEQLAAPAAPSRSVAVDLGAIHQLLAHERFGEALAQLDALRATMPGDRDVAMLRAVVLTHAGQFEDMRAACGELLASDAGADFLCIRIGGEPYAIAVGDIASLHADLRVVPLPSRAPELLGVAAIRAAVVPIYDLCSALGIVEAAPPRWIALHTGGVAGFAFDGYDGHVRIPERSIATATDRDHVRGQFVVAGQPRSIVELGSVLTAIETRWRPGGTAEEP